MFNKILESEKKDLDESINLVNKIFNLFNNGRVINVEDRLNYFILMIDENKFKEHALDFCNLYHHLIFHKNELLIYFIENKIGKSESTIIKNMYVDELKIRKVLNIIENNDLIFRVDCEKILFIIFHFKAIKISSILLSDILPSSDKKYKNQLHHSLVEHKKKQEKSNKKLFIIKEISIFDEIFRENQNLYKSFEDSDMQIIKNNMLKFLSIKDSYIDKELLLSILSCVYIDKEISQIESAYIIFPLIRQIFKDKNLMLFDEFENTKQIIDYRKKDYKDYCRLSIKNILSVK